MIGAELGYRYVGFAARSGREPGEGPDHDFIHYVPTTWPGRAAAACLAGRRQRDAGPHRRRGYSAAARSAARRPMPLRSQRLSREIGAPLRRARRAATTRAREVYGYDLLLLRPDMHVAWRGNAEPADAAAVAAVATGHAALAPQGGRTRERAAVVG